MKKIYYLHKQSVSYKAGNSWIISLLLISIFLSDKSYSQSGALDLSFDFDGKALTPIGNSNDSGNAVALQSDGKIVVAGYSYNGSDNDFALVRYNPDGSLDNTFDTDGKVTTNVSIFNDIFYSVAIQSDGKILAAGKLVINNYSKFALLRYLSDGTLDPDFGNVGSVFTTIGSANAVAQSAVIQPDGKIILAGNASIGSYEDFAIVRYNADGSLDQSFGTGGIVTTPVGQTNDYGSSVALQDDGRILLGGSTSSTGNYDFALVRYNENGTLDTSFDTDGKLITDFSSTNDYIFSVAIQDDGKIVVAGRSGQLPNTDFALARYNADGTLDTGFDTDGKVTTSFGPAEDFANAIALHNNKIVVAGYSTLNNNKDFAVAQYNADGSLDSTFGVDGKVSTPIADGTDIGAGIVIQDDGKIIVAGVSYNGANNDFSIVRYNADVLGNVNFSSKKSLVAFPNPVATQSNLNFNAYLENVTISFVNSLGKQVKKVNNFSGDSISIDRNSFSSGFYTMQLTKENNILATIKFIVK